MQAQTSQTRTNRRTGEVQVMQNGQWVTVTPPRAAAPAPMPVGIQLSPGDPYTPQIRREQLRGEQLRNRRTQQEVDAHDPAHAAGGIDPSLTGPAALDAMTPADRRMVQSMIDGHVALPTSNRVSTDPNWQRWLALAQQVDPQIDQNTIRNRQHAQQAFLTGPQGRNVQSLNTALEHVEGLSRSIAGLHNFNNLPLSLNNVANSYENWMYGGGSRAQALNDFMTRRHLVSSEVATAVKGGHATIDDIRGFEDTLRPNMSPDALNASVDAMTDQIAARLREARDSYRTAMGRPDANLSLISPTAAQILADRGHGDLIDPSVLAASAPGTAAPGEQADRTSTTNVAPADPNQMQLSHGDTQADPGRQALNNQLRHHISQMMKSGVPDGQIATYAQSQGISPMSIAQALAFRAGRPIPGAAGNTGTWQQWRRQRPNDDYPIEFPPANRPMGTGAGTIAAAAASGPGTAFVNSGNAIVPASLIAHIVPGGDPEQTQLGVEAGQAEHPGWALGGNLAGTALAYGAGGRIANGAANLVDRLLPTGAGRLTQFLRTPGAWRSRAGDAIYGAIQGAGEDGDPLTGAVESVGGGMAGRTATRAVGSAARGVTNLDVRALTGAKVPLSIGQILRPSQGILPRFISSTEDRLAGLPLTGDIIGASRYRGYQGFNSAAFARGLRDVPGDVTTTGASGVGQAQNITSRAYRNALDGVNIPLDPQYHADMGSVRTAASNNPLHGDNINYTLDQVGSLANPDFSGQNMQAAREMLRGERGSVSGPLSAPARDAYTQAEGTLTDLVDRQSPGTMPDLINADRAYRNTSILGDAVGSAKNRADELFTPAQLGTADFNNTVNFGGRNAARAGRTPFYALRSAGNNVLGNMIPDSGTAGRSMMYGLGGLTIAGAGGGASGYSNGGDASSVLSGAGGGLEDALALSAALYAPHSRLGQRTLQTLLVERPQALRDLGTTILDSRAPRAGGIFGTSVANYLNGRN